ncbi:hypothetical protein INT43_005052 [Umbelopsis isabellina]|uniref:Amino acid transporter n=1 Tax=Mortierella isabellina TaxID=91625 RepID=A0A8H7UBM0_MORIS|nr:hypothetical protein INT43_005052 [Umbelopsis isabellina]
MSRRESSVQVAPAAFDYSDRESLSSTATVSVHEVHGKGTTNGPAREPHMGLLTSCNMIVGLIIGSGIFASPGPVLLKVVSVGAALCIWALGGVLSMMGALCYAELGCMIVRSGGEYQYLKASFGRCVALSFTWSNLVLSNAIGTASVAIVFAGYICNMAYFNAADPSAAAKNVPAYETKLVAIGCIWAVVIFNCLAQRAGSYVSNIFTGAKVLALIMIIIIGFVWLGKGHVSSFENSFEGSSTNVLHYGSAMYLALFSYNGWNNLNYGISEVKNPEKNLPLAIIISCVSITVAYILANIAYLAVLPVNTVATSTTVAMQLGIAVWGTPGAYIFALMVVLSTFGAVNASIWAASRVLVAAAEDGIIFPRYFNHYHQKTQAPVRALILTGIIGSLWCLPGDYTYLANIYSFIGWLWYGITIAGLVYMRFKPDMKHVHRPFKVWLPVAIVFLLVDVYLVIAPLVEAGSAGITQYAICIVIALFSVPVWFIRVHKPAIGRKLLGWIPGYEDVELDDDQDYSKGAGADQDTRYDGSEKASAGEHNEHKNHASHSLQHL